MSSTYQNGTQRSTRQESDRSPQREPQKQARPGSGSEATVQDTERARTIIQELKAKDTQSLPTPDHRSAKKMDGDEVEALLLQFVSEKLAHAHLSAQIDNPTRQSVETMAKAWTDAAETIVEAVRRVDRQDPPTSFWEMQS